MELDEYSSNNTAAVRPTPINSTSMNTKVVVAAGSESWNSNDTNGESAASMKIFTSVMLHAWRQRRADVHRLKCVVERLQKSSMQTKNELHVCNTLIRVEQRRCSELQLELKKSNMSIKQVRNSCDVLNKSVATLRADKEELQQDLHLNKKEFHELEHKMITCKDELLSALLDQRGLQHQLAQEQQLVALLNKEKKQLLDEVTQLCNNESEFTRREKNLMHELDQKVQTLKKMSATIEKLEQRLKECTDERNRLMISRSTSTEIEPITISPISLMYPSIIQLIDWSAAIDQFLSKVKRYSASAAYFIWYLRLPYKSMRYGCTFPPRIHLSADQ